IFKKREKKLPLSSRAATVGLVQGSVRAQVVDLRGRKAEDVAEDLGGMGAQKRSGAVLDRRRRAQQGGWRLDAQWAHHGGVERPWPTAASRARTRAAAIRRHP